MEIKYKLCKTCEEELKKAMDELSFNDLLEATKQFISPDKVADAERILKEKGAKELNETLHRD
jgi:hypothetical protein